MCIVKATETEIEAETETATEAEANRGDALTKCYEIKFTHKASLMTRQATRTARRQGQQQQQQQQQIITTTTTRTTIVKQCWKASQNARLLGP